MSVLDAIRGRRDVTVDQMLMALELVPASDTENRRRLLAIAARGLGDAKVAARWIALAADEKDTDLKAAMVARAASLDPRHVDVHVWIRLLVDALSLERVRLAAIEALARLVRSRDDVAGTLIAAYRESKHRDVQRLLLRALAEPENPPPATRELLLAAVDRCDADLKPLLVDRLLRTDAITPDRLLDPHEPVAVRLRVLHHAIERSLPIDDAVLAKDPDPACRRAAVMLLAARGRLEPVLDALRRDPDESVRAAAAEAFEHALDLTPAAIDAILAALLAEKSSTFAEFIIGVLTPHVARSPAVRAALQKMLAANLDADVAVLIYRTLGRLVVWDESWLAHFARVLGDQKHDRVRAAILEALSGTPDPDDRLVALHHAALKAPEPKIREWGLRGVLQVSMSEPRCAAVAAAADVLLDRAIDWHLRLAVARKIAAIPDKPAALVARLKKVAEQADDELKDVCRKAYDIAASEQGAEAIDWDGWYRRVDVEKEVKGVFPGVFLHYDSNPEAARRIMRAALAPDCSNALYYSQVNVSTILDFLAAKDAVDDDISRYCVTFVLTKESNYGSPNYYLALLKCNPGFPALKESLAQILDRRADSAPNLMRELLEIAHGGEEPVAALVRDRLLAKTSPKQALPWLKFLAGNAAWEPAEAILMAVPEKLLDADNRRVMDEAYRLLQVKPPKKKKPDGPGLADE